MTGAHAEEVRAPPGARTLLVRGATALVVAVAVNWALVLVADLAGVAPDLVHLDYPRVGLFTTAGVVGATATYGVLTRVASDPDRVFTVLAAVLLVVSLIPDFTVIPSVPGGTLLGGAVLAVMHVTTAVACVVVLTDVRRRP